MTDAAVDHRADHSDRHAVRTSAKRARTARLDTNDLAAARNRAQAVNLGRV
jgi:hypothetical protein